MSTTTAPYPGPRIDPQPLSAILRQIRHTSPDAAAAVSVTRPRTRSALELVNIRGRRLYAYAYAAHLLSSSDAPWHLDQVRIVGVAEQRDDELVIVLLSRPKTRAGTGETAA